MLFLFTCFKVYKVGHPSVCHILIKVITLVSTCSCMVFSKAQRIQLNLR